MGRREGGYKTRDKILANDPDFYRRIGRKGGKSVDPKKRAFYLNREAARHWGQIGGKKGKRGAK